MDFPGGSVVKNLLANAGYAGLIPGQGRSPEEGDGNPLQLFLSGKSHRLLCPWQAIVLGSQKSQMGLSS